MPTTLLHIGIILILAIIILPATENNLASAQRNVSSNQSPFPNPSCTHHHICPAASSNNPHLLANTCIATARANHHHSTSLCPQWIATMATDSTMTATTTPMSQTKLNDGEINEEQEELLQSSHPALGLPIPSGGGDATRIGEGTTISLDHLGPIVVNQDGTLSRVTNWDKMTEIEKRNTLRVLGKRNRLRMEKLKAAGGWE